jgi:hypothetical protein
MSSFWKKHVSDLLFCPVCQKRQQALSVRLIAGEEDVSLSHATCPSCQSSFLYVLKAQPDGAVSVGMVTDLLSEDLPHLLEHPVSADDILALHTWLASPWETISRMLHRKSAKNPRVPIDKKRKISHNSDRI